MKKKITVALVTLLMGVLCVLGLVSCGRGVENVYLNFVVDEETVSTIETSGSDVVTIPDNPQKDGYTFDGWYWDKGVWSKSFTANSLLNAPISSDMSVYAKLTPIQYTITYHLNGGSNTNPASYTVETPTIALSDAVKEGCTFLGWYKESSYNNKVTAIVQGSIGNIDLYANFSNKQYTISFDADGGSAVKSITQEFNTIVKKPTDPIRVGYSFQGWFENGFASAFEFAKMPAKNVSLKAKWVPTEYSITYNLNGGTNGNNPATYTIETDGIILESATKVGYSFNGWYDGDNKIERITKGSMGNLTLNARWMPKEYSITYENTKSAENNNPVKYTIESENITLADLEKSGYTFNGWYNGTQKVTEITKGSLGNLTLTADWTVNGYEITYHNIKGATINNPDVYDIEDEPLTLNEASKPGYTFLGWYTDAQFTDKIESISVETTGDKDLYAKWEIIEYTATFKADQNVVGTVKFTVEDTSLNAPAMPDKVGYSGVWETYTLITQDLTVSAIYTPIEYTITYENTKGAANSNLTNYTIESEEIALESILVNGYTFDGWYDGANKVETIATGSHGNKTLTAKWTANTYTITFMSNGGSAVDSITQEYESVVNEPTKPTRERFFFLGWYVSASATEKYEFTTMPSENLTLYAKWEAYSLTVTYNENIKAVSAIKGVTAEAFEAVCTDNAGERIAFTTSYTGTLAAGETITVRLQASSNGVAKQITISNVKVYGTPTITVTQANKDYINLNEGLQGSWFGASGTDTYGAATQIVVRIDGDYQAGDIATVHIDSVDAMGNVTTRDVENVKLYGLPEISYNTEKVAISVNDTLSAELFGASATDSFGEVLTVTATRQSGAIAAGNTVTVRLSAADQKGNIKNVDIICKVYGAPTISSATTIDFKIEDEITIEKLGVTATDTYNQPLDIDFAVKSGEQTAGNLVTYIVATTDVVGNTAEKEISVKIYGTPTIDVGRTDIKANEMISLDSFCIEARDSFHNPITARFEKLEGTQTGGAYMKYRFIATDRAGNTHTVDCKITVYDENDIKLTYMNMASDLIKLSSKGEEFSAMATDSFGEPCEILIEPAQGYTLAGGQIISLYVVATDKAGNKKYSEMITGIKVYDMPMVILDQEKYKITVDVDVNFIFTVYDSFGEELIATVTPQGELVADSCVDILIEATDDAGNVISRTVTLGVMPSERSFIELYVDGKIWQTLFLNEDESYFLPVPEIPTGKEGFWLNANNERCTKVAEINNAVAKFDFVTYQQGYMPIVTASEFKAVALDGQYQLVRNIDLGGIEWTPIGTETSAFSGTFNGNGYVISNFKIMQSVKYAGLFGNNSGTIKNLGVEDFTINVTVRSSSSSHILAGGLVGNNSGSISNCYATGNVSSFSSSSASGPAGYAFAFCNSYAGGLVGKNSGSISNCYATGNVSSSSSGSESDNSSSYAGGLVGYSNGSMVNNCYATGDISSGPSPFVSYAGGLVGYINYGDGHVERGNIISNCYATGNVTVSNDTKNSYAGGLVGGNADHTGSISNCYRYSGQKFTVKKGSSTSSSPTNTEGTATSIVNLQSKGWLKDNLWFEIENWEFFGEYPTLNFEISNSIPTIYIYNAKDLKALQNMFLTWNYELLADIDLEGIEWIPIAYFSGTFNGNGHVISNFRITGLITCAGLFGNNRGTIKNLGVDNCTINVSASSSYAGGLIGRSYGGSINNCYATGDVSSSSSSKSSYAGGLIGCSYGGSINNCYATGDVSSSSSSSYSSSHAGGLVGSNGGSISNCYATGDVTASSSYSSSHAGGLVGSNGGSISNCYATGDVTASSSSSSSSSYSYAGGLVGYNNSSGNISSCYCYSGQKFTVKKGNLTSSLPTNIEGTAKTKAELQSLTFQAQSLGWSSDDWLFTEGAHPTLKNVGCVD